MGKPYGAHSDPLMERGKRTRMHCEYAIYTLYIISAAIYIYLVLYTLILYYTYYIIRILHTTHMYIIYITLYLFYI